MPRIGMTGTTKGTVFSGVIGSFFFDATRRFFGADSGAAEVVFLTGDFSEGRLDRIIGSAGSVAKKREQKQKTSGPKAGRLKYGRIRPYFFRGAKV
jgi:hypothetical protein